VTGYVTDAALTRPGSAVDLKHKGGAATVFGYMTKTLPAELIKK
jgi:hypothetical protein